MVSYQPIKLRTRLTKHLPDEYNKEVTFWGVEEANGMEALRREGAIHLDLLNNLITNGAEFLITVSMYNEGVQGLANTFEGI